MRKTSIRIAAAAILALGVGALWMRKGPSPKGEVAVARLPDGIRETDFRAPPECAPLHYFPLEDDACWKYALTYSVPGFRKSGGVGEVRIDGRERIGGHLYHKVVVKLTGVPGGGTSTRYYRFSDRGIYCLDDRRRDSGEWLFLPLRLRPGSQWTARTPNGKARCRVEEGGAVSDASGAVYTDCLKVTREIEIGPTVAVDEQWIARDVGPVKKTIRIGSVSGEALLREH